MCELIACVAGGIIRAKAKFWRVEPRREAKPQEIIPKAALDHFPRSLPARLGRARTLLPARSASGLAALVSPALNSLGGWNNRRKNRMLSQELCLRTNPASYTG